MKGKQMDDLISRKALCEYALNQKDKSVTPNDIMRFPSARPERLTDDDFETIRIHLNAYKEKLCNQQRWEEANEYQRIIDRFMAFASAQPETIRCKDCKYRGETEDGEYNPEDIVCAYWESDGLSETDYCSYAERRTDEAD